MTVLAMSPRNAEQSHWHRRGTMTTVAHALRCGPIALLGVVLTGHAPSPQPVKLSTVLSAFVPAAGTQTRGLSWTTAGELPIKWENATPVAPPAFEANQGFTMKRTGALVLEVGAELKDASIQVLGNQTGVQQVTIAWQQLSGPFDQASLALAADGVGLTPLKCRRETETASFGNLVQVAQFKGKIGVALWENWNCGHDGCGFSMTLLYRRTAADQVECVGQEDATAQAGANDVVRFLAQRKR